MGTNFVDTFLISRWQWWAGGMALGLTVPLLYLFFNTALGVSTGYGNILKIILRKTKIKWLYSAEFADKWNWRVFFMAGIITGGFISGVFSSGGISLTLSMFEFTGFMDFPFYLAASYFFTGGVLLGLGSRIAGGCTSGHSIHGIAQLHISSIIVTIVFVIAGAVTANIIRFIYSGVSL